MPQPYVRSIERATGLFDETNVAERPGLLDASYNMAAQPQPDPPVYTALMRIRPEGMSNAAWAAAAGKPRNIFNGIKAHGNPTRITLEQLLGAIGWTIDRFEAEAGLYPVQTEVRGAGLVGHRELSRAILGEEPLPPLPLYGSAQGGEMGEQHDFTLTELDLSDVLDYLQRPAALADDKDSYALTIIGASMVPRFKPGERVGVSPKARVEIGDDVIVQLRGENTNRVRQVLIKELVRRSATHITLAQYNPPRELRIERKDILAMHKVKGHFL
jgi:phage repressor protein C with HTH and peptisase S24 domain